MFEQVIPHTIFLLTFCYEITFSFSLSFIFDPMDPTTFIIWIQYSVLMVTLKEIARVTSLYELGEPVAVKRLSSGYSNENYELRTAKGTFLYRICREKDEKEILHEMKVLEKLREIDFPAAYPLKDQVGNYIFHDRLDMITLFDFIEGHEPEITPETVQEIGEAVARLNSIQDWRSFERKNALSLDLCHRNIGNFDTSRFQYPAIFEYFREETEYLEGPLQEPLPRGLVHGDVFPDNTLFQGHKLAAILDFEEVCTDHLLYDVGVTINGFCFRDNRLDRELMNIFLDAYSRIRPLSENENELLPYYIQWGAHAMIAWHLKHLLVKEEPRKLERLHYFMDRVMKLREEME